MGKEQGFVPEGADQFNFSPLQDLEIEDPMVYVEDRNRDHYSNKGSHKARSDFWKDLRRITRQPQEVFIDKTDAYIIRRKMQRTPKDGR